MKGYYNLRTSKIPPCRFHLSVVFNGSPTINKGLVYHLIIGLLYLDVSWSFDPVVEIICFCLYCFCVVPVHDRLFICLACFYSWREVLLMFFFLSWSWESSCSLLFFIFYAPFSLCWTYILFLFSSSVFVFWVSECRSWFCGMYGCYTNLQFCALDLIFAWCTEWL